MTLDELISKLTICISNDYDMSVMDIFCTYKFGDTENEIDFDIVGINVENNKVQILIDK